jgi:predicted Fe-S protein YdhL (DUF1289 family)
VSSAALLESELEVASPCVNICRMNETSGYCEGCFRNLDEIAFWSVYEPAEKRAVLALLPARRTAL